jgi:hypothetical protein
MCFELILMCLELILITVINLVLIKVGTKTYLFAYGYQLIPAQLHLIFLNCRYVKRKGKNWGMCLFERKFFSQTKTSKEEMNV